MAEGEEPTKVSTESSKKVLKTVAGRLSKMEAGDLPTIERVAADGSTRAVDHTGEMIRPSAAQVEAAREANRPSSGEVEAAREAAEQFSAEHRAHPTPPAPKQQPPLRLPETNVQAPMAEDRPGLWARIMGWFKRS